MIKFSKILSFSLLLALVLTVSSCGNGYNESRAKEFVRTVNAGNDLSETDYNEIVNLYCAYLDARALAMMSASKTAKSKNQYERAMRKFDRDYLYGPSLAKIIESIKVDMTDAQYSKVDAAEENFEEKEEIVNERLDVYVDKV